MELEEILKKLNITYEQYYTDALSHSIVQSLIIGTDPLKLLGHVIENHNRIITEYRYYIEKCPIPPRIIKKEGEL